MRGFRFHLNLKSDPRVVGLQPKMSRPAADTEASRRPREKISGTQGTPQVEELKRTTYLRNKSSFVEVIKQFRIMKSDQLRKHR